MDISHFLQDAKKMQETLQRISIDMEEKYKERTVIGRAGGQLVEVCMNLKKHVLRLDLKPTLFEESPDVISELILAAFNQAVFEADNAAKEEMMHMTKQFAKGRE
jgi:DNA-binding YbaB/EbfC family protein